MSSEPEQWIKEPLSSRELQLLKFLLWYPSNNRDGWVTGYEIDEDMTVDLALRGFVDIDYANKRAYRVTNFGLRILLLSVHRPFYTGERLTPQIEPIYGTLLEYLDDRKGEYESELGIIRGIKVLGERSKTYSTAAKRFSREAKSLQVALSRIVDGTQWVNDYREEYCLYCGSPVTEWKEGAIPIADHTPDCAIKQAQDALRGASAHAMDAE